MLTNSLKALIFLFASFSMLQMDALAKAGPDHSMWNNLLQKHVTDNGKVDYGGFVKDIKQLDAYLAELAQFPVQEDWPRNHQTRQEQRSQQQ